MFHLHILQHYKRMSIQVPLDIEMHPKRCVKGIFEENNLYFFSYGQFLLVLNY